MVFLFHVFLARHLGPSEYGTVVYALAWLPVVAFAGKVGMDRAAIRFPATYHGEGAWGELRGFLRFGTLAVVLTSGLVVLLATAALTILDPFIDPTLVGTLAIGLLVVVPQVLLDYLAACLRGLERVRLGIFATHFLRPGLILVAAALGALFWGQAFTGRSAMWAYFAGVIATLAITFGLFRWGLPKPVTGASPRFRFREWVGAGTGLVVIGGMQLLMTKTDLLLLGALRGASEAGLYSVGQRFAELMVLTLFAVNAVYSPMIARYHAQGDKAGLQGLVTAAMQLIGWSSLPLALILIACGPWLVAGLFGGEYAGAYPVLVILVIGQMANALAGSVGFLMTMTGHHRQAAVLIGWATMANIGLNLGLIPVFGMVGAAVATATTTILWNGLLVRAVVRYLGVDPTVWAALRSKGRTNAA
jgi:O-antigen/teichoic acid export membrane protein